MPENDLNAELSAVVGATRDGSVAHKADEWVVWLDGQRARRSDHRPIVVITGETKRGKSTFLNAVGVVAVATGFDNVTNTYMSFVGDESERAVVYRADGAEPFAVPASSLSDWVTERGNPDNERGVASVEVRLGHPLLQSLTLIDTPGIGSLNAAHGEVTLAAVARADALIFVVDASSPITADEVSIS